MTSDLSDSMTGDSVAAILADLEAQIEHHQTQRVNFFNHDREAFRQRRIRCR